MTHELLSLFPRGREWRGDLTLSISTHPCARGNFVNKAQEGRP